MIGAKGSQSCFGTIIPKRLKRGLLLLLTSHDYAIDLGRVPWDFATEIASLRRLGLTKNDFRWLGCKGLVDHAAEITMPGSASRQFQPQNELTFSARTCFVLTEQGVAEAEALRSVLRAAKSARVEENARESGNGSPVHVEERPSRQQLVPRWDAARHELRLGQDLVKSFKLPSPNQETILVVFEEEGWPPRIDDPLPPHPDMIGKQRLHDTIKSLNRNQRKRLVRFLGDGTGLGVCWELISQDGESSPARGS